MALGRDQGDGNGRRGALGIVLALFALSIQFTEVSADPLRAARSGCHRDQKDGKYHCHYGNGQVQGPGPNSERGARSGGQGLLNGSGLNEALSEIIGRPVSPNPTVSSDDLAKALEAINGSPRPSAVPDPEQPGPAGQPPVSPDIPKAVALPDMPPVPQPAQPAETPRPNSVPEPPPKKQKPLKRF